MISTNIKPKNQKTIEITIGRFRLTNVIRLTNSYPVECEYISASKELALEERLNADTPDAQPSYYVIAFFNYVDDEESVDMRTVGDRFVNAMRTVGDMQTIKYMLKLANDSIVAANSIDDSENEWED